MEINIQIRYTAENSSTSFHDFVYHNSSVEEMYGKFARVGRQSLNHGCAGFSSAAAIATRSSCNCGAPLRPRTGRAGAQAGYLRAILDEVPPFNIIHFAGHLCEEGFVASTEIIPLDMIVMYIQTGKPELVFFNTCSSEKVAEMVASRCESDCIFTISNIENDDAIEFSEMFYSVLSLSEVHSYKEARDRVDPTGSRFRYLPGKNMVVRRGDEVMQRLDALERTVGGGRLGEIGIIQRQAILEARVADFEEYIKDEIKPTLAIVRLDHASPQKNNSALLWAIFGASFIAAVGIASLLLYMVQR